MRKRKDAGKKGYRNRGCRKEQFRIGGMRNRKDAGNEGYRN